MDSRRFIRTVFADIRFWIILFLLIRMTGITNPPLETGHSWRQCFTNMVARNFLETGSSILYPRMDMAGNSDGVIGSEFPLYNYLIYVVSLIFGFGHWYGRLINLIVSSLGIYFFYRLARQLFGHHTAFGATIILMCSIWFAYSRKIMPDTFSVSLVIAGMYYCHCFIRNGKLVNLILFFILTASGTLSKLPSAIYLGLLSIPVFSRDIPGERKAGLVLAAAGSAAICCFWYFIWVPHLVSEYGNRLYFPAGIRQGVTELIGHWPGTLEKFYFSSLHSFTALAAFMSGLFLMFRKRNALLTGITLISFIIYMFFMVKAGRVFSEHNYYIIPFTPMMSLSAGFALSFLKPVWRYLILALIMVEGIANQWQDFFIKDSELYKLRLEEIADRVSEPSELIIINSGDNPQEIYFAHRKGWTVDNHTLTDSAQMKKLVVQGADYLFVNRQTYGDSLALPVVYVNGHYQVYRLGQHSAEQ